MAVRVTFEMVLSDEACKAASKFNMNIPKIACTAVQEEITSRIISEEATVLRSNQDLREHIVLLEAQLNLRHAQELQGIIRGACMKR